MGGESCTGGWEGWQRCVWQGLRRCCALIRGLLFLRSLVNLLLCSCHCCCFLCRSGVFRRTPSASPRRSPHAAGSGVGAQWAVYGLACSMGLLYQGRQAQRRPASGMFAGYGNSSLVCLSATGATYARLPPATLCSPLLAIMRTSRSAPANPYGGVVTSRQHPGAEPGVIHDRSWFLRSHASFRRDHVCFSNLSEDAFQFFVVCVAFISVQILTWGRRLRALVVACSVPTTGRVCRLFRTARGLGASSVPP